MLGLLGGLDVCYYYLVVFVDDYEVYFVVYLYFVEQGFVFGYEYYGHVGYVYVFDFVVFEGEFVGGFVYFFDFVIGLVGCGCCVYLVVVYGCLCEGWVDGLE